jgi:hypothetical protein
LEALDAEEAEASALTLERDAWDSEASEAEEIPARPRHEAMSVSLAWCHRSLDHLRASFSALLSDDAAAAEVELLLAAEAAEALEAADASEATEADEAAAALVDWAYAAAFDRLAAAAEAYEGQKANKSSVKSPR